MPIELRFRHRDGSWRYLECLGNNQLHNPAVGGIIVNSRDISDRKIAEQERADFMAMIAHDLRSPLNNVIGASELMKDGVFGPVNEEQQKWLVKVSHTANGLVSLVSDFLDMSKLESGRIDLALEEVDFEKLFALSLENFHFPALDKKIALRSNLTHALPQVRADPHRLEQVLNNLLSNALKFTPSHGEIELGAGPNDGGVKIWIRDTGAGIPPDEIGQLFEKYKQTMSGKTSEHKGTGLGLVICKMIIEAHGGRIWVQSEQGKGTIFTFTLPTGIA
ncbi:MAG: ATP-binding protein [Candidatus Binatia bacterium]